MTLFRPGAIAAPALAKPRTPRGGGRFRSPEYLLYYAYLAFTYHTLVTSAVRISDGTSTGCEVATNRVL